MTDITGLITVFVTGSEQDRSWNQIGSRKCEKLIESRYNQWLDRFWNRAHGIRCFVAANSCGDTSAHGNDETASTIADFNKYVITTAESICM